MSDNMDNVPILKDGTANPNFLMTRKQAISVLQVIRSGNMKSDGNMLNKIICDKAISLAIRDLKRPHVEWIPCSERLPDKEDHYLMTVIFRGGIKTFVGFFIKEINDFEMFQYRYGEVLAWMPLPKPYKAGDDV